MFGLLFFFYKDGVEKYGITIEHLTEQLKPYGL